MNFPKESILIQDLEKFKRKDRQRTALVLALIMVQIALPHFNRLMGRELSLWASGNWYLAAATITVLGLIGFLNAVFPFLAVSRFNLNHVIKGGTIEGNGSFQYFNPF